MEIAFKMLTTAGLVGTTAMLAMVGLQLGRIRSELRRGVRINVDGGAIASSKPQGMLDLPSGHAIYVYRNAHWQLEADFSKPGFEPMSPGMPGAYEGQAIKKQSMANGRI